MRKPVSILAGLPPASLAVGAGGRRRILGVWSYERKGGLEVEIEAFGRLPEAVRAVRWA
jgi:hypothetical protein